MANEETQAILLPARKVDSTRYVFIFDEALCAIDPVSLSTCDRLPDPKNPHKHYTVFQMEIGGVGELLQAAVNVGFHQKECLELDKELSNHGVKCYLPEPLKARLMNESDARKITLKREKEGAQPSMFYIDVRDKNDKLIHFVANYSDNANGYKVAHRKLLSEASKLNLPYEDHVGPQVLSK